MIKVKVYCSCGQAFTCYVDFTALAPTAQCPDCGKYYIGTDEIKHQMLKPVVLGTDDTPTISNDT